MRQSGILLHASHFAEMLGMETDDVMSQSGIVRLFNCS